MKRILLLTLIAFLLNGCRYINPQNQYLDAKEGKPLEIPAGLNEPVVSSELDVPKASNENKIETANKTPPPEMPIRTKQTSNGDAKIESQLGYAVLSVKTEKTYMWQAMEDISIENWTVKTTDKDNCTVDLEYNDLAAREREDRGFFRKLFTRKNFFSDYSGLYTLRCEEKASMVNVKFTKGDGSKPNSFLADNVMNVLFDKFQ
ncbi:MAG: hypothetical protein AB8B80_00775 [Marinicellaceae bacterium]